MRLPARRTKRWKVTLERAGDRMDPTIRAPFARLHSTVAAAYPGWTLTGVHPAAHPKRGPR